MTLPTTSTSAYLRMCLAGPRPFSASILLQQMPCRRMSSIFVQVRAVQPFHGYNATHTVRQTGRASPLLTASFNFRAAWQVRQRSTSAPGEGPSDVTGPRRRPPKPPPKGDRTPFFPLLLRILRGSLRSIFMPFRGQTLRNLYRSNPEELILALAVLVAFVFVFAYVFRIYFTYFYSRQFTRYPPSVAKHLRRAIYFSNYKPDPPRALKNYKQALEQCDVLGLDPFSDDVLGIRIQLAAWLEQIENYDAAIKILELLLADLKRWVDLMEKSVGPGGKVKDGEQALSPRLPRPLLTGNRNAKDGEEEADVPDTETVWGRRSRILRKAIGTSVKLGELYSDEHVLKPDLAHKRLIWSVDTALAEFRRRNVDGTKEGEGEWMSPQEMGAALESLGQSYEIRSQFHLALPLFFQALRLCSDPCHSAVIMNNLAISFAQHPVQPPYETLVGSVVEKSASGELPTKEDARKAYLETAQRWAQNAQQHAADTSGDARTPECDEACVVSLCNLGDIAALLGDFGEAERRFREARAMSEKMEYAAGIKQADAGLKRLP